MIEIQDIRYCHMLSGGGDPWRIYGRVFNHPSFQDGEYCYPSTPTSFNEEQLTFTTNNHEYKIISFAMDKDKFIEQIKKDIFNSGFEIH